MFPLPRWDVPSYAMSLHKLFFKLLLSFSIARRKELIYQVRSMLLQMLIYNQVTYLIVEFFVSSNSVDFDIGIPSSYLQIKYKSESFTALKVSDAPPIQ